MQAIGDGDRTISGIVVFVSAILVSSYLTWRMSINIDQKVVAGLLIFVMIELALVAPKVAIITTMVYQAINGDLRRILMAVAGRTGNDPLLLVAPSVLIVVLALLIMRDKVNTSSRLSKLIIVLSILMVLQALNPLQGSLMVGLMGLFLFLCPMCWYWIGQHYGTAEFIETMLVKVFVPMALVACVYTFYQAVFGVFDYQYEWLIQTGMITQAVGNVMRPSGFFPSPTEMGLYVSTAAIVLWAGILTRKRVGLALLLIPVLMWAAMLQGSRGIVVTALFVGCVMWAVAGRSQRSWLPRLVLAVFVGFGGLIYSLTQVDSSDVVNPILKHQAKGVLNPGESTAQTHGLMMLSGVLRGTFANPVGYGIGSTTIAADRANTGVGNMEADFSNLFLSLGVVGGVLYLSIVAMILIRGVRLWLRERSFRSLALLGICIIQLGHYLTGMHFAMTILVWFCIGTLERLSRESDAIHLVAPVTKVPLRLRPGGQPQVAGA